MEVKESERIVIAKPVASRPTFSTFRSFSELLAGAINYSPPDLGSEIAVAAIRPKTLRFRPTLNRVPQAQMIDTLMGAPTVVYKPLAKLVSKTTVSNLANSMVNPYSNNHQEPQPLRAMDPNQDKQNLTTSLSSNIVQNVQSRNTTTKDDSKAAKVSVDRPSYDEYNWRKYGQKQVKGSEYLRSYYKCTHPNCPVKKKVEKLLGGQIAEIVYKGEHSHSKPQPPKRSALGTETMGLGADGSEGRVENQNEVGLPTHLAYHGNAVGSSCDLLGNGVTIPEDSYGLSRECEEENDERGSKRRKKENQANEEPHIVVHSSTDTEIIGDGFRWRKYGQKVVKGNPYPRSYYRCTSQKCNMRKHVERASEDPKAFITTYEGKHNHDMPLQSTNAPESSKIHRLLPKTSLRSQQPKYNFVQHNENHIIIL